MSYDVTIGIPFYQVGTLIRRSLLSALSQSYASIEFLLVDDGCTDDSVAVVSQVKSQHPRGADVRVLSHPANRGVSASRNLILQEARGRYLYFMDADDAIAPQTIALLMAQAQRYHAQAVFASYVKIETTGEQHTYQYSHRVFHGDELAAYAYRRYGGFQASACNFLVLASVMRDSQLRFLPVSYWEDMAFTTELVTLLSCAVTIPDVTYYYYCRNDSLSHYQQRQHISKQEIVQNMETVDTLKRRGRQQMRKEWYPARCFVDCMTSFYVVSSVLKHRRHIEPPFSYRELRRALRHPAPFAEVVAFRQRRLANLLLWLLAHLPAILCVAVVWMIAKVKKLI